MKQYFYIILSSTYLAALFVDNIKIIYLVLALTYALLFLTEKRRAT